MPCGEHYGIYIRGVFDLAGICYYIVTDPLFG